MGFFDDKAYTINDLIGAVIAIEEELGPLPAGVYASVRTRLDILEARINNPYAPAPNVNNPFYIGGSPVSGVSIQDGYGDPNLQQIPAIPGSLYLREDGYNIQGLYAFRPDGYWHQIDTDPWMAAGDLSGTIYSQTVVGLQNRAINPAVPQIDSEGDGYVLTWNATANGGHGWWEPQIGFFAAGDLSGNKISQTLVNIQGNKISAANPSDGFALTWNNTTKQWEPQRQAIVFNPLDSTTSTSIVVNRTNTQSGTTSGLAGANNFGNNSPGNSITLLANYSSILGGDQNQISNVAAAYSTIVGGLTSNITAPNSFVGGGSSHTVSGPGNASVVGGATNTASGQYTFIGGGTTNATSGQYSVIVGGSGNTVAGQYASVINGASNSAAATGSFIGSGTGNTISGTGSFLSILNGQNNQIGTGSFNPSFANILGGQGNLVDQSGTYSTILGGLNNIIHSTVSGYNLIGQGSSNVIAASVINGTIINGVNNQISAGTGAIIAGSNNTITSGTNPFVIGLSNGMTNASYSAIWGHNNTIDDQYIIADGYNLTLSLNSAFSTVYGHDNTVGSSLHTAIWGSNNVVGNGSNHTTSFGSSNIVSANSPFMLISGNSNTATASVMGFNTIFGESNGVTGDFSSATGFDGYVTGNYSSVFGNANNVTGQNSNANGQNITITGNLSTAFGLYHSIATTGSFVHGQYAKASNLGQYSHAGNTFDGTTAGTAQFSRMLLSGTGPSGAIIPLTLDGTHNINTEATKCYDMEVRILVTDANPTNAGVCARYVFGILAHTEGSTLTIDRIDAVLLNDNGTNWVGNNWTSTSPNPIFITSGTQLVITVPPAAGSTYPTDNRRAVATVEWRELTRN